MSNDALKKLVYVVQELSLARSMDVIMAIVRRAARELSAADGAAFVLRDQGQCFYADEDAIAPLWKGQRFPMQACISGWSMLNRKAVAIEDIYSDPRIPFDAYQPTFVKSLLMVPIRTQDPIGAIGVYWATQHHSTADELELMAALADTVSVAMENVHLNSALEQRVHQLEDANRIKDEFLMTLSHELRTPLNGILGWAEILKNTQPSPAECDLGLDTIVRNSEVLNRLIDDLLDTSRIVSGRLHFEKKPFDPIDVIRSTLASVSLAANARNIRIDIAVRQVVGTIVGDPQRLQQVLWNLLTNALKFTPPGGAVVITLERANGWAKISIKDNGEGIDPDFLPYVFDRFRQADSSTIRRHGGLGLGLALARHLVEAHGGRIEAASEGLGLGATFTLYLPLAAIALSRSPHLSQENEMNESLAGLRILVVDDVADARIMLTFILESHDAVVEEAAEAGSVLNIIDEFQPDLLLSDLGMPGEDGYSLIRRIRSSRVKRIRKLPAIAVTAYADQLSLDQALDSGFDAVFSKPIQPGKLVKSVLEILKRRCSHAGDPQLQSGMMESP